MATIQPNSIIKLFTGIPLDNTYTDTLYFETAAARDSYFNGLTPLFTFTENSYQRVTSGIFEADCSIENIYNANYMMFQNTGFENKWFYAFVTDVEYINNHNCRVHYEIDVMMSWLSECTLKNSFIERQHSYTDRVGDNILPEPVSLGEYKYQTYTELNQTVNHYAICIMRVEVDSGEGSDGNLYDNVYSGGQLYAVDAEYESAAESINDFLSTYIQKPESIVNMYMVPLHLLPIREGYSTQAESYSGVAAVPGGIPAGFFRTEIVPVSSYTQIDGYTPRNKKLWTYPYFFYHVDNGDGAGLDCRYEFFTNGTPQFQIDGCITAPVQLRLTPLNYKGAVAQGANECRSEFITIAGYPVCSWNYDTYRAWAAQNSVPMALQGGLAVGGLILAAATGGVGAAVAAGAGVLGTAISAVKQGYTASIQADVVKGNLQSGNVNFSKKKMTFYGGACGVTHDYALMIDRFFDMFGYAYNKVGTINTHSRPHWNYVKTNGCKLVGRCPADAIAKIKQIFDAGVTFWKSAAEVGNYSQNNAPSA